MTTTVTYTYTFDLPEDDESHQAHRELEGKAEVLRSVWSFVRSRLKYHDLDPAERKALERVRQEICDAAEDHEVSVW